VSDYEAGTSSSGGQRLRKASDFSEQVQQQGETEVRRELQLPDVDGILKELQGRHGVRISLSPALVERLESIKETPVSADAEVLSVLCPSSDICIVCDQNDRCDTCDALDWCISVDTH
jgi:hypothetical protein